MLRVKVNNYRDRENLVVALANSGYAVRVSEEKMYGLVGSNFYVELLDFNEPSKSKSAEKLI